VRDDDAQINDALEIRIVLYILNHRLSRQRRLPMASVKKVSAKKTKRKGKKRRVARRKTRRAARKVRRTGRKVAKKIRRKARRKR